ncbi:hypothetical protein C1Y40_05481 [Mycobacterium talmoniae]|nr:hypothetical protein C1Y40_05481 [Mycobacterium talmoniae]
MLGAAGVLMGTRFYAAAEALSTAHARDIVASANGDSTCRTSVYDIVRGHRWPEGQPMAVLRNAFTDRWHGAEPDLRANLDDVVAQYQRAVADGDYRIANIIVGQAVGVIHASASAADIVAGIAGQAAALLGRDLTGGD